MKKGGGQDILPATFLHPTEILLPVRNGGAGRPLELTVLICHDTIDETLLIIFYCGGFYGFV